jgi:hypothetical protein
MKHTFLPTSKTVIPAKAGIYLVSQTPASAGVTFRLGSF